MQTKEIQPAEINVLLPDHPVTRISLDQRAEEVGSDGRRVKITPTEIRILTRLLADPLAVMTARNFAAQLYNGVYTKLDNRAVAVNVSRLNEKLKRLEVKGLKICYEGEGYTFVSGELVQGLIDNGQCPDSLQARMRKVSVNRGGLVGNLILILERLMAKSPAKDSWTKLTGTSSSILDILMKNHDAVVTHRDLTGGLSERNFSDLFISEKARLAVNIYRLRQHLGIAADDERSLIVAAREGYMLVTR